MFPVEFENKIKTFLKEDTEAFLKALNAPQKKGIRVNALKIAPGNFKERFPCAVEENPLAEDGVLIKGKVEGRGKHHLHLAGAFDVQEPSAQGAVTARNPQKGEKILDLCAAPGGKSLTRQFSRITKR